MLAIGIDRFGGPEEMTLREVGTPVPGDGEVLVKVEVAGVNFIDVYMRNGSYARSDTYKTPLPMTLGMEAGGTVAALGSGVRGLAVGDRVAYCLARGSYAEYAVVPAWRIARLSDGLSMPDAVALMLQGFTAHYLTHSAFALKAGDTCLVHAAAGGVGQLVVQIARARGATVFATVGSEEKAQVARACGADHVILYRETDFHAELMRLNGGRGVDVVYDSVGKDTIERSIRSVRRRGLCVLYGASSGQVPAVSPLALAEAGSVFFTRPHLADYLSSAQEIQERSAGLLELHTRGALKVSIHGELPLAEAAQAHRILESRGTRGKLLLRVRNESI